MIIQAKDLPVFLIDILRTGSLFGTIKPDGSTRPIALIDILRRWITKAVAFQYKKKWAQCLGSIQYAVGISGGNEKIIHTLSSFIEAVDNNVFCIGEGDCRNAFNSCNREMFMLNLKKEFFELYPFFYLWYSGESKLIFEFEDGSKKFILSSEGTTQGDPGAMFLFCVGLKTPLTNIQNRAPPQTMIVSFADNINLGSEKKHFNTLWNIAENELAAYNLQVRRDKSYVHPLNLSCDDESEAILYPEGIQILTEGFKSLGVPIGSDAYVEKLLQKILQKNAKLLNGIVGIGDNQISGLLLRYCANTRINYWNRVIPPQSAPKKKFLQNHDEAILLCFKQTNNVSSVSEIQKQQFALPLSMGGMGFLSAVQHSSAAYIGSVTEAVKEIWERNNNQHFIPSLFTNMGNFKWIKYAEEEWRNLNQSLKQQDSSFEGLNDWNLEELCSSTTSFDFLSQPDCEPPKKRMQSFISHLINSQTLKNILSTTDNRTKTRILSAGGIGSAGFLYAIPKDPILSMTNIQMETAIKLRLGCDLILNHEGLTKCECGQRIDSFGDHLLACKNGSEKFYRHNMWLHSWERLIKKSSSPSLSLEKSLYELGVTNAIDAHKRIDFIEYKGNGQAVMADVSITHPTCSQSSEKNKHSSLPGHAAENRQKAKHTKYDESAKQLNMKFVPLIAETYGRLGSEALSYAKEKINELATVFSVGGPKIDNRLQQKISLMWWTNLSVILQKGNAHIIISKKFQMLKNKSRNNDQYRMFDMNDICM